MVPTGDLGRREAGAVGGREVPRECGSEGFFAKDGLHSPLQPLFPHRIHLMAGRVPKGADRATVRGEMETVFLENLRHAAEVLAQVRQLKGLPRCHSG